jgi:hypothetical protein
MEILVFCQLLKRYDKSNSNSSPSQVVIVILFWQKQKKHSPAVPHLLFPFISSWENILRAHIYARSYLWRILPYQKRWKGKKIILSFLVVPDLSFQEVKG